MKKVVMALGLILSSNLLAAGEQILQAPPECPCIDQVKATSFDSTYSAGGKNYAYYGDLVDLGTSSYWYEAELNLSKPDLLEAQSNLKTIDIQENTIAQQDTFWGYELWVCHYKSSRSNVEVVTASPIDRGGFFSSKRTMSPLMAIPSH